ESGKFVPERSLVTGLGVGVPGSPRGLFDFHEKLGRLPFETVAAPAIELAEKGFRVDQWLADDLGDARLKLERQPGARALFFEGDETLAPGRILRQPELAATLRRYAKSGPSAFYEGEVAEKIVIEVRAARGVMSLDDLADYRAVWRPPLRGWFRGLEIVTAPPPSSGGIALLEILSLLDGFPLDEDRVTRRTEDPSDTVGLSDRAEFLGDPDQFPVPVAALLSPERIHAQLVGIGEFARPGLQVLPARAREG